MEHLVNLPLEHWACLDWLITDGFTDFESVLYIAWRAWSAYHYVQPDVPFQQAFGYSIEEANTQYESQKNGFTNDNA